MSFFRVNNSVVDGKNIRVDEFILDVQCFSPDALDITSACLSADQLVVILTVAAPDKFVQDARQCWRTYKKHERKEGAKQECLVGR
jgi:hypothetical protein